MKRQLSKFMIVVFAILSLTGCINGSNNTASNADIVNTAQIDPPKAGDTVAIVKTNMGNISIKLFPDLAPKTVENFTTHAKNGYYNNLVFHRVIKDFMIQGGDPNGDGTGGESIWGKPFEDEINLNARHLRGSLSMANSGANTNGSQFFIVQNPTVTQLQLSQGNISGDLANLYTQYGGTPHLDGSHTVFGQTYEGFDVLDNIAKVATSSNDVPVEPVTIETIEILTISE